MNTYTHLALALAWAGEVDKAIELVHRRLSSSVVLPPEWPEMTVQALDGIRREPRLKPLGAVMATSLLKDGYVIRPSVASLFKLVES